MYCVKVLLFRSKRCLKGLEPWTKNIRMTASELNLSCKSTVFDLGPPNLEYHFKVTRLDRALVLKVFEILWCFYFQLSSIRTVSTIDWHVNYKKGQIDDYTTSYWSSSFYYSIIATLHTHVTAFRHKCEFRWRIPLCPVLPLSSMYVFDTTKHISVPMNGSTKILNPRTLIIRTKRTITAYKKILLYTYIIIINTYYTYV